jgi:hypothetical protein
MEPPLATSCTLIGERWPDILSWMGSISDR